VDWLWRPFELDNLIMVLRGVHNEMPASRIRSSLIPLGPACYLDWHVLSNSKSVSEVIDRLGDFFHGRFYARALKNAQSQYQRRQTVFFLEVALYIAYYRRLNQLLERLHGPDRKDGERFVGAMIDSQNVLWAYRYRIFFRFGPETVLSYTLPRGGRRVDATVIQRIATGAPLTELVGGLWNGELRGLRRIEDRPPREALVELEVVFRRHLYDLARNALTGYPFRLGMILAYGILLRAEVDDLIAVMEGLANGLSADRISSCLIRFQRTQS
jgi:vacuolar-type H+-ATPase subunit C/Vma6